MIAKMGGIDLNSAPTLKHDINSERNRDERLLISLTRGDFFIPMIMHAVVLRHLYSAFKTRSIYRILHYLGLSFCK